MPGFVGGVVELGCVSSGRPQWSADGFPRFKTKTRAVKKFSFTTGTIRVDPDRHHITLPRLGTIKTHESTRKLARRVQTGTARILKATVRFEQGRWWVSFSCIVVRETGRPPHVKPGAAVVGVDAGVKDLLVVADPARNELARHRAPRELKQTHQKLRALQRKAARQVGPWDQTTRTRRDPSRGWVHTQHEIGRTHARVAHLRADRTHKLTTRLSQSHDLIGAETLAVKNMMTAGGSRKRGLNRALSDASLGALFRQLDYKTSWYGSQIVKADGGFPALNCARNGCGESQAAPGRADLRMRQLRAGHRPGPQRSGQPGALRATTSGPEYRGRHGRSRP